MQPIIVRPATAQDLEALNRFQQAIVTAERSFDATIKDGPVSYYDIARMLASDKVRFVVATAGADLVGCGYARIDVAEHYLKHAAQAYLGLMYVKPRYRGQSVNRKIIEALKHWCRSAQVTEMRLEVYHDNIAAIRAYEKSGFRRLLIEMRLDLTDDDGR
jgi:ribosomal protein S18 acetylase RimI-like enzyme